MRLLIISHTPHYHQGDKILGWGPTVIEIDHLSSLFDQTIHLAPLYDAQAPASALPYKSSTVKLKPIQPAGGDRIHDKLGILTAYPAYTSAIRSELSQTDVVHVRCPANVSLLALLMLTFTRKPVYRWVKYAGNWHPDGEEPRSYTFQRWLLAKGWTSSVVTINGKWPDLPEHVIPFINPCLTSEEIKHAYVEGTSKQIAFPLQLLFVGALSESKGARRIIEIARLLVASGLPFNIDIIGDSPLMDKLVADAATTGVGDQVIFHGWQPKDALGRYYTKSHILLLPSLTEGWPKVISEAMAYGVVPLAGAVSSIPQILRETGTGRAIPPLDVSGYVDAVIDYANNPEIWKTESLAGIRAASQFTYAAYLDRVNNLFQTQWGVNLREPDVVFERS